MNHSESPNPPLYSGVMVSSTFTDLEKHRSALLKALQKEKMLPIGMENYVVSPEHDVISSSLDMVKQGSAYIGLISHRCGQVPKCTKRNPHEYSITRLEFEEAQSLGMPTLIFVMGDSHALTAADVETNARKKKKLEAFRVRAKEGRIYVTFNNIEEFEREGIHAVARLRQYLNEQSDRGSQELPIDSSTVTYHQNDIDFVSKAPAFHTEHAYIGSHEFVGRKDQLETLGEWAAASDSHSVLLFEAIGGTGKSILAWQWATRHALEARSDWAGRFWYSFYESESSIDDFCRRALAYIIGCPVEDFQKKKSNEIKAKLLAHLRQRPWLLILDGLERVLVSFQRYDAAYVSDELAGAKDPVAQRDPCAAVRPEDDDLLRNLAIATPSKLLITTRLTPKALLNQSNQAIPGVVRIVLSGLRPIDAENLLRNCDVTGSSNAIQSYLKSHCDCHPLTCGALAGLINDYLPNRGNFDAWAADSDGGGQLKLANLSLVQKREHILLAALKALSDGTSRLLATIALFSGAVDYLTLADLNPYLPPKPEEVEDPAQSTRWKWHLTNSIDSIKDNAEYQKAVHQREEYEQKLVEWHGSLPVREAPRKMTESIIDLERRGLLQYDSQTRTYDIHPVVRSIVADNINAEDKGLYSQRVVDYFLQQPNVYDRDVKTIAELSLGICAVKLLLQLGHYGQAHNIYRNRLSKGLSQNLEADDTILGLLKPFFPTKWHILPEVLPHSFGAYLVNSVANCLPPKEAILGYVTALIAFLNDNDWTNARINLHGIARQLSLQNRLVDEERHLILSLKMASAIEEDEHLFRARLDRFQQLGGLGRWAEAEEMWQLLNPMGRDWDRNMHPLGMAEYRYAQLCFWKGTLMEEQLVKAENLAFSDTSTKRTARRLHDLRGRWLLEQKNWLSAAESLSSAVRMAHEVGKEDIVAEVRLALAKFHLDNFSVTLAQIEQLAEKCKAYGPANNSLAELWLAAGETERAIKHAIEAYKWAWADGEPYVHRYEMDKAISLLTQLEAVVPILPPYNPKNFEKLPWEYEVEDSIEQIENYLDDSGYCDW
jgi:hypothetical protein